MFSSAVVNSLAHQMGEGRGEGSFMNTAVTLSSLLRRRILVIVSVKT
jgi:hypothetical protein